MSSSPLQPDFDHATRTFGDVRKLAGRYRLLHKIGEGGAAEVFCAHDDHLDRPVAIKLLHPQFTWDKDARQRFSVEAKVVAGLSHPNIVSIYDFGEGPDGTLFIVMQFIEGMNLRAALVEVGRFSPQEMVAVALPVCGALSAAHARGLVHRDVKPHNIMVDREGGICLTDFGIVKAISGPALTQTGMTFGTAAYLSPEQATGAPVSPASDIYSLGCVMYEMLAGTPPFIGDNPVAVAYKQVWEQPPPLHMLAPHAPASLEAVVMRCLHKDPGMRYTTTEALAADLRHVISSFGQATQPAQGAASRLPGRAGTEILPPVAANLHPSNQGRQLPARTMKSIARIVPPVKAHTTRFGAAPVAQPATDSALPYVAVEPNRAVQVVNVSQGRRKGWLPAAMLSVVGLGLGLAGLFALMGGRDGSSHGAVTLITPTTTPVFMQASETSASMPVSAFEPKRTATTLVEPPTALSAPAPVPTETPVPVAEVPPTSPPPPPPIDTPVPPPPPTETAVPPPPPLPTETPIPPPPPPPPATETPVPPPAPATPISLPVESVVVPTPSALEKLVDEVLAANPEAVKEYLAGKKTALFDLLADVIKKTKGKVDIDAARDLIMKKLEELKHLRP